jgi:phosphotransferase system enzyme I (PtsI)
MREQTVVLQGRSLSPGFAVGRAEVRLEDPSIVPVYELSTPAEVEEELDLYQQALAAADAEASADETWARENLPDSEAEIFSAQRAILRDPELVEWVEDRIRNGRCNAAAAVRQRFDDFRTILHESSSEIIRNRILDVTDAERLILSHLLGWASHPNEFGERTDEPIVLVTLNPPPSLLARVDPDRVVAIVCEQGAGMSHIAVLARALNLPAVIQVEGLLAEVRHGDLLALDADRAELTVNPSQATLGDLHARAQRHLGRRPPRPSDPRAQRRTIDGDRIYLAANALAQRDVEVAAEVDADGIGLYRTEYLYLARNRMPTEADLVAAYSEASCSFRTDPVDFRLLDLGSDKHLVGMQTLRERNPALGLRSLRFLFEHPELLRTQVRAILQAGADGPVRLLLPMVSCVDDIRRVRDVVAECHEELRREGLRHDPDVRIGAMIEHAAGLMLAPEILAASDFVSIGTNDLTMYVLAADRDAAHLAAYYDPFHPAVIRALRLLTRHAADANRPLSLCGEMASDPSLTGFLVGLGFRRLSLAPSWILPVGQVIRKVDTRYWSQVGDEVERLGSADLIRKTVRQAVQTASAESA